MKTAIVIELKKVTNFKTITEKEFYDLAYKGVVGPYKDCFSAVGAVINKDKPIALVYKDVALIAQKHYCCLISRLYYVNEEEMYAVYNYKKDLLKLKRALKIRETGYINGHILVGRALGYSDKDIAAYLLHNYGFKRMKNEFNA